MAIAWEGACQSNGSPGTYYKYEAEWWNRRADKVHVRLKLWLRMAYRGSYFSFAIGHECKVNGVYRKTVLKNDRTFWGGWSTYGYLYYGSNYADMEDGTKWHRRWDDPYIVFDGDVPIDPDSETVTIIPCITRPCICRGGSDEYALNPYEKCNWEGYYGVWQPWGPDGKSDYWKTEYVGYWANRRLPEDGVFLNNVAKEPLYGGLRVGRYPRIAAATNAKLSPSEMDVAQVSGTATVTWELPSGAAGTHIVIRQWKAATGKTTYSRVIDLPGRVSKYEFVPHKLFGEQQGAVEDGYRALVTPYDSNGVEAVATAESNRMEYVEHKNPNQVQSVNITSPTSLDIDVRYQDTWSIRAEWPRPKPAKNQPVETPVDGYKVFVGKVMDDDSIEWHFAKYVKTEYAELKIKDGYKVDEVFDGERFVIGVQSADEYGAVSDIEHSAVIRFYEVKSVAPTEAYLTGRHGSPNYVLFKGEDCSLSYRGQQDGSYPITRYQLYRLSDGAMTRTWSADIGRGASSQWTSVVLSIRGIPRPNSYEVWELRAYNSKGRPVYSDNEHGTWTQITVYYYGGLIYVFDGNAKVWRDGICYVYDDQQDAWHEAELVYVYDNGEWRSL